MTEDAASLAALRTAISTRNEKVASNVKALKLDFGQGDLRAMVETKKCQIPGVSFKTRSASWRAQWYEHTKEKVRYFPLNTFQVDGVTETEASLKALEAAIDLRTRKVGLQNHHNMKMILVVP